MSAASQRERDQHKLVRGVGLNFLGSLGRALVPAFYILANQIYGPAVFGLYALAIAPTEILTNFVVTGFSDAIQRFTARDADRSEPTDVHYAVMWRCLLWVVGASVFAIVAVVALGPVLAQRVWDRADIYPVLVMFAGNVPIVGAMIILLAAARAVMDMKGDALVRGLVTPLLLMVGAVAIRPITGMVYGLGLALTLSNLVGLAASIWYFRQHYSLRRLFAARRLAAPPGLLAFAVPQSLNMTLWQAIWNLDVVMLGAYVDDARLGLYRTATEIARVVFSIRLSFSSVYAPLVARYTLEGDLHALKDSYTRLSRWISIIAAPVVMVIVLYQQQILWLFNPAYGGGAAFLWLLLIGPLLACSTGLSGNILVMTGHNLWNLANSAVLLALNAVLNLVLIPRWGMMGASLSTMIATTGASVLQIVEVWWLLGVKIELRKLYKPFVAAGVAYAAAALPVLPVVPVVARGVIFAAVYVGVTLALKLEPEDAAILARRRARPKINEETPSPWPTTRRRRWRRGPPPW